MKLRYKLRRNLKKSKKLIYCEKELDLNIFLVLSYIRQNLPLTASNKPVLHGNIDSDFYDKVRSGSYPSITYIISWNYTGMMFSRLSVHCSPGTGGVLFICRNIKN